MIWGLTISYKDNNMTSEQKSYLISQLSLLLDQMVDTPEEQKAVKDGPREMLTLQECTEVIKGVSAHAIRVLIAKGEIQALRVEESSRARILVPKDSLLAYFDRLKAYNDTDCFICLTIKPKNDKIVSVKSTS